MRVPLFFPLPGFPSRKHAWRWLLPVFLLLLFLFALLWLPWQAQHMESTERQEQLIADTLWVEQTVRFQLGRNEESLRLDRPQQNVVERLMFWQDPPRPGTVLDPQREAQRLRENSALGRSPEAGDTPIIQRRQRGLLDGLL